MLCHQARSLRNLPATQTRSFWGWINIIFNRIDEDRRKAFGPDRSCAEWLLRNGAAVKWLDGEDFLRNYNHLPPEGTRRYIQEVDATDSSIMHYGFDHFKGCNHVSKIILHKCGYLENEALKGLTNVGQTLRFLQVSSCGNIDEAGLAHLSALKNLNTLILFDLPYVKDKNKVLDGLKRSLGDCNVSFE